ncbi:MAG: hypothetical protein V3T21_05845 [Candidatus Margulisiibacteriota bacterium]
MSARVGKIIRSQYRMANIYAKRGLVRAKSFVAKHQDLMAFAAVNLAALPLLLSLKSAKLPLLVGICWERNLRDDVANAARQKILKELTRLDEFNELIEEVEPALRDALSQAMAEISQLERSSSFDRTAFRKQQETIIQMIEKQVWETLEPKIQDAQKKARLRAWIDNLKGKLSEVDEIQQRAADVLRENVREILYDLNEKTEDELGQSIPGEIEGGEGDNAMHVLAETIVEKIMDRDLDPDIAMGQIVSEIGKSGVLDTKGNEKLISGLLKDSKTNDGETNLENLFTDFRKTYLDPGAGTLHLPKEVKMDTLDQTKRSKATETLKDKGEKKDGESN